MLLPIFPLPNVVLFPNVFLPLHIFEPRYREMVRDALAGDRIIGMVLLRDARAAAGEPAPPVYPVGCAGLITHRERLADGRFNIVLRGLHKFRIREEDDSRSYRRARVEAITEPDAPEGLRAARQRLERLLARRLEVLGSDSKVPSGMADADLVNALSQYLEFDPLEKQALLERNGLLERCQSLSDLLEMKAFIENGNYRMTQAQ